MEQYTIIEVANLLIVNPETVRRWVRSGRLKATFSSRKRGHMINKEDLCIFLKSSPKYAKRVVLVNRSDSTRYSELETLFNEVKTEIYNLNKRIERIQSLMEEP